MSYISTNTTHNPNLWENGRIFFSTKIHPIKSYKYTLMLVYLFIFVKKLGRREGTLWPLSILVRLALGFYKLYLAHTLKLREKFSDTQITPAFKEWYTVTSMTTYNEQARVYN